MAFSEIEIALESLAFGGEAVGRGDDGRVVFVAGGAPGDRVRARIVEDKRSFRRGEVVAVLSAGERVVPPCPLADRCGGCPWMHVTIAAQAAAKQSIVARALAKSGADVRPIAVAPATLGYRTRARMSVRVDRQNRVAVGFSARRSHDIVDVDRCIALEPTLDGAMQAARRALGPLIGDEGALSGLVRDGAVELAVTSGRGARLPALATAAQALVGQASIVRVSVDDAAAPAAGFAQANDAQNERLRQLARDAAQVAGQRVLELYAGDGNFTRDLLPDAASGVAEEGDRHAVVRLHDLVTRSGKPWTVSREAAAPAVDRLVRADERFDVVLLDPPRAGAADVVDGIARLRPARIVYVSCDPMTLARDVARLTTLGYRAQTAWPVDMMPHTWHVEVVCSLVRR
ncbi:MAG TPA: TRAM domain-containing protein [Polyangia bacterium]|nr:TRAM domain-containing protein [Polyangia bacterium]